MADDTTTLLQQIDDAITDAQTTAQEMEELYTQLTLGQKEDEE